MAGTYKLRKLRKPDTPEGQFDAASIAIPMDIAKNLPDGLQFTAELTDEGILFRPARVVAGEPEQLPAWLKEAKPSNGSKSSAKSGAKATATA
jgi:hypothetical protein